MLEMKLIDARNTEKTQVLLFKCSQMNSSDFTDILSSRRLNESNKFTAADNWQDTMLRKHFIRNLHKPGLN